MCFNNLASKFRQIYKFVSKKSVAQNIIIIIIFLFIFFFEW